MAEGNHHAGSAGSSGSAGSLGAGGIDDTTLGAGSLPDPGSPRSADGSGRSPTSTARIELDNMTTPGSSAGHPTSPVSTVFGPTNPQYVEFDESAGPQVVIMSEEDTGGGGGIGVASAATAATAATMTEKDDALERSPGRLARLWIRARKSPYIVAAIFSFTIGILALIILPVVLHNISTSGDGSSCANCTTASTSTTATSTSATPTSTDVPSECAESSAWISDVSYMGIADSNGDSWPYRLLAADDATECCTTCYSNFQLGCQGWAYLPWDNTPVPCTIIYGWNGTSGETSACPNGEATISFSTSSSRANSTGGAGPCGTI